MRSRQGGIRLQFHTRKRKDPISPVHLLRPKIRTVGLAGPSQPEQFVIEPAPHGVRVLAVGPGAIKTPINRSVWSDPKNMQDLLAKIPLKRIGKPEEIARMAVVLVSDVASYVAGRTIFVDGGMTDYPDFAHGG